MPYTVAYRWHAGARALQLLCQDTAAMTNMHAACSALTHSTLLFEGELLHHKGLLHGAHSTRTRVTRHAAGPGGQSAVGKYMSDL